MIGRRLFFLFLLTTQTISRDIRSIYLTELIDTKYQCNTSGCSPLATVSPTNLENCRIAYLNDEQCQTVTFDSNTRQCEMFANTPSQYGNLSLNIGTITMISIERQSSVPMPNPTTATSMTTIGMTGSPTSSATSSKNSFTTGSTTTALVNPCVPAGSLWNTTAITILASSQVNNVANLYFDRNGTLYIADESSSVIWKLLKNSTVPTVAAGSQNNTGSSSDKLFSPQDVHVDRHGNLYVSDGSNYRVQKYINGSKNGITIAGQTSGNGGLLNQFNYPKYFTFDDTDTYMYIADSYNSRIMRYLTNSTSGMNGTVVAGSGSSGDTSTTLNVPHGIHSVPSLSSDLFLTNRNGYSVMRWTPGASSGVFIAGTPGTIGSTSTTLNSPMGIRVDNYFNVYVADSGNNRIQMFCVNNKTGITIAGAGGVGNSSQKLNSPRGIAFDEEMNLYVADYNNKRVQKFMKL